MNEKQVISELKKRNTKILKSVYETYQPMFLSWAGKKYASLSPVIIEDVYSEAVIDFYENIIKGKYKHHSSIKTYLFTLGRNKLVNIIKHKMMHQSKEEKIIGITTTRMEISPERENQKNEHIAIVKKMMDELCQDCRKVLTSFYFHDKSMNEIAEEMNYKNANVAKSKKNLCFKKLQKLTKQLYAKADFFE